MPAATILFVAQPIKQGVRGIGFWNFSLLEHPTINTKEFQNGKKSSMGILYDLRPAVSV